MPRAANAADWVALLVLTGFWGTSFAFTKIALTAFPPSVLVAGRVLIAAAVLTLYMRARGVRLPTTARGWLPMVITAVFGNLLPFQLIAWAQTSIDSAMAAVLMAVMPLFVLTLAHFYVPGSRLTAGRIVGFVLGFTGVALVVGPDALDDVDGMATLAGAAAVLAGAFSYSVNSIYARQLGPVDPVQLSAGMLLVSSLLCLPGAAINLDTVAEPSLASSFSIVILGLLSTGIATLLYFRIIQGPGPTFLSLINYLVPAWAVVIGVLFLGEELAVSGYLGMLLILSGIAFSELGPRIRNAWRPRAALGAEKVPATPTLEDARP